MIKLLKKLYIDEEGQGLAEYGLILALIAVICVGALLFLGNAIKLKLNSVGNELNTTR